MPSDDPPAAAVYVGCAGWSLPRDAQPQFPAEGVRALPWLTRRQRLSARLTTRLAEVPTARA